MVIVSIKIKIASLEDAQEVAELYNSSFKEHIMVQRGLLNNPDYLKDRFQQDAEKWVSLLESMVN